ncbi:uncharacterized protein LOC115548715 isoform X1 [Xyrichtys novacula]|uniref:Uncharacterized protein LOC115548715 isoform X1 n=1 Tax=Xyrichtys novacula TaxID=13765 RepID=A0AAV1EXK2_XYRNO|nr:uncharacterized protein LOC115548715 isoform X1 [Xyrichtys novacula]
MDKTSPELLREAANLIEEALRRTPSAPVAPAAQTPPAAPTQHPQRTPAPPQSRTPVEAEVARLFAPYNSVSRRVMRRRPAPNQNNRTNYTHTVFCLADSKADKVPSMPLKADLQSAGLGEARVTFSGDDDDPKVITNKLMEVFPKLQERGGFELLRIVGSTRSRNLGRHMQESESEQGQSEDTGRGTVPVNDSAPVTPETASQSSAVPTVIDNKALEHTETDSGMCHHNRFAVRLSAKWKLIKEPAQASKVFKENLLWEHASGKPLKMRMDVRDSEKERERELLSFYKWQQEWACPLHCTLVGDVAVGEGVMRYFMTTVISKLQFGFSLDLEDCPDLHIRSIIKLMLLQKITWPVEDSDDEDFDVESTCRITGFLRMFIETASSGILVQLLKFWVGWEMLPPELRVEISGGSLPTSSRCFETLKLPAHFKTYEEFEEALFTAINSAQSGFGLV